MPYQQLEVSLGELQPMLAEKRNDLSSAGLAKRSPDDVIPYQLFGHNWQIEQVLSKRLDLNHSCFTSFSKARMALHNSTISYCKDMFY